MTASKKPTLKARRGSAAQPIELVPDAWPRFERLIKQVAKAGPQHRKPAKAKTKRKRAEGS